jgi:protein-S-isoprenylcysteine O-methyltransferase Ste14
MSVLIGKIVFLAAIFLEIVIRYPYREQTKQKQTDRQEQVLLLLIAIGGLLLPMIFIFTSTLDFANYYPPMWVIGLGIAVMSIALFLFWRAHADLGRNWSNSLEIFDEHKLVTQGVYRQVRHPMYSAMWLMGIGQMLLLPNWVAGFAGIIGYALLYFLRVPKEEEMMLKQFGDQYQDYMATTGRIIPKNNPR